MKFLHINNDWRDHNIYVMFAEDLTGSMVSRSGVPSKNWKAEGKGK